eukprot:3936573-Rhodomonas_salina.1
MSTTECAVLPVADASRRELERETSAPRTRENWKNALPVTVKRISCADLSRGMHAGRPHDAPEEALVLAAGVPFLAEIPDDVVEDDGCVRRDDDLEVAVCLPHPAEEARMLADAGVVAFHDEGGRVLRASLHPGFSSWDGRLPQPVVGMEPKSAVVAAVSCGSNDWSVGARCRARRAGPP